jgi:hypothetical protein
MIRGHSASQEALVQGGRTPVWLVIGLLLVACAPVREYLSRADEEALVDAVSLTAADAAEGAIFEPYEGGRAVADQISLDLCFARFDTEAKRVARNQVGIGDGDGSSWVSSEAILYSSPEVAEEAMRELESARRNCPDTEVPAPTSDRESLTWRFTDPPDGDWPKASGIRRQSYAFTVTDPSGAEWSSTATYLQRGRMILALYATPAESAAAVIKNAPEPDRFASVMTRRLAALPDEALNTTVPAPEASPTGGIPA